MGLFWHFSDVVSLTGDVGSWGQSGLTADIAETTLLTLGGHFDPLPRDVFPCAGFTH
jgi:hypothetical protein